MGKNWFGRIAALTASFLYTISPVTIIYSRSSWNPNPLDGDGTNTALTVSGSTIYVASTFGTISLDAPEGISMDGNSTKQIEDGKVMWVLKGNEGEYLLEYAFNNEKYSQEVLIKGLQAYKPIITKIKESKLKALKSTTSQKKLWIWDFGKLAGWERISYFQ